nr:MAG TPA: hypothetical protein [Caudoviricetes sp.]
MNNRKLRVSARQLLHTKPTCVTRKNKIGALWLFYE